jgi:hypothetical protein
MRRISALPLALLFAGCGPPPPRPAAEQTDPTATAAYSDAVAKLQQLNKEARAYLNEGKRTEAGRRVEDGARLVAKLLDPSRPTLAAVEAVSDRDQIYGEMLLHNGHVGHARQLFANNLARWRSWRPATDETEARRKQAERMIAECDRRLR